MTTVEFGALNEGRRLSPATRIPEVVGVVYLPSRSTKAGGYPRLRGLICLVASVFTRLAQRRPEVIPGYELLMATNSFAIVPNAQRRPEVIPGYEALKIAPLLRSA